VSAPRLRVGTSGFSYPAWKPRFYPKGLPASKMLDQYASRLATVEINNTFYRRPDPKHVAAWAARVPADFRFVFKASRYFSAGPGLRDAKKPLAEFFALLAGASDKLGAVLVQLPPHLKKDLPLLRDFLAAVPHGKRVALDLRDPSWRSDDVRDVMRRAGVAWCATEADDEPLDLVLTAPFTYVRLRKTRYDARALATFAARLHDAKIEDGYVVFKHDPHGTSALHAEALQRLL
jgi:uncharacterized protein YecE (DUF72 family)